MALQLISFPTLNAFPFDAFRSTLPFPWHEFHKFLTPEGFQQLYDEFPPLTMFEKHEGLARGYGQRPHNRYYLAYRQSVYHPPDYRGPGVIQHDQLPSSWQRLVAELEGGEYRAFLQSALGTADFMMRYAWHVGVTGSDVSPHRDVLDKIGIHLLYFNTSEDWNPDWGGQLLVLGDKRTSAQNPAVADFGTITPVSCLDNRSLFFKNTPDAWHGVQPLACPPGKFRRLFDIIIEARQTQRSIWLRRLKRLLRGRIFPGQR